MSKLTVKLLNLCSLYIIAKSYTHTMSASPSCAPDTMKVTFWFVGETKVDDGLNIRDIKTPSNKISSKQIVHIASLENLD